MPPPAHSTHTPHFHPHPLPLSSLCFVTEATQSFSFVAEIVLLWLICSLCACTIRDCIVDVCIFYFIITLILTAARDENSNNKHLHTLAALSRIRLHRVQLVGILVLSFSSFFSWGNFWKINPWNWNLILLSTSAYACVCVCVGGWGGICVQLVEFYISPCDLFLSVHSWPSNFIGEKLLMLQNFWGGARRVFICWKFMSALLCRCLCLVVSLSLSLPRALVRRHAVYLSLWLIFWCLHFRRLGDELIQSGFHSPPAGRSLSWL